MDMREKKIWQEIELSYIFSKTKMWILKSVVINYVEERRRENYFNRKQKIIMERRYSAKTYKDAEDQN